MTRGRFSTTSLFRPHRQNAKRACDACRSRKKKCSAESSGCSNCRELNVACVYSDGKRELNSKRYREICQRLALYDRIVRKLSRALDMTVEQLIFAVENREKTTTFDNSDSALEPFYQLEEFCNVSETGASSIELLAPHQFQSSQSLDSAALTVEILPTSSSSSVLGGNENFSLLSDGIYSSQLMTAKGASEPLPSETEFNQSYKSLPATFGDGYSILPLKTANTLIKTYFTEIHHILPIFESSDFLLRYRFHLRESDVRPCNQWLALLNYIFASAALYLQLSKRELPGTHDHQNLASTAKRLLQYADSTAHKSYYQTIQAHLVGAFYYLGIDEIQHACEHARLAASHAAIPPTTESASHESTQRLRSGLSYLENLLSIVVGRPLFVYGTDEPLENLLSTCRFEACRTNEWLPLRGSQQQVIQADTENHSSQHESHNLHEHEFPTLASKQISAYLYELDTVNGIAKRAIAIFYKGHSSLEDFQNTHWAMIQQIEAWKNQLPGHLNFMNTNDGIGSTAKAFRARANNLACSYYSTVILITWPALIQKHRDRALQSPWTTRLADQCIAAAMGLISLLPNCADLTTSSPTFSWWYTDKYFLQATTVLTNEIAYQLTDVSHRKDPPGEIQKTLGRAVECLDSLAVCSSTASQAQEVVKKFLQLVSTQTPNHDYVSGTNPCEQNFFQMHQPLYGGVC